MTEWPSHIRKDHDRHGTLRVYCISPEGRKIRLRSEPFSKKWWAEYAEARSENDPQGDVLSAAREALWKAAHRSKIKGRDFDLDVDWLKRKLARQGNRCAISGILFSGRNPKTANGRRDPFLPSLDRIDPDKGYTRKNTRIVCLIGNIALSDFGEVALARFARGYIDKTPHFEGESE